MWRPDNWQKAKDDRLLLVDKDYYWIYGAGADAMLEALKEARFPYTGNQFIGLEITEDGQLLIILKS